ncbi:VOC family protein [Mesobacillus sp. AQ2]|uniref:VOC family protein n=1 Tax=Bacillaceae TaxID=186817 RepID=UPI0011AA06DF|nr:MULTISPECIES: VOC family protein [Bacillaceae]WHX38662.1 VOC family protein [Mesobacillus sp. AQ2]
MRFHHLGIEVSDLQAAKAFYEKIFGFKENGGLRFGGEDIFFLEKDGFKIELIGNVPVSESGVSMHLCFEVDHLNSVIKEFRSRNIIPIEGPYIVGNWRTVFYPGLERELIEFLEVI